MQQVPKHQPSYSYCPNRAHYFCELSSLTIFEFARTCHKNKEEQFYVRKNTPPSFAEMATTEQIFAMIGKVLGVIGMLLCMLICYFAWKFQDVARIVNENTLSSGRKRTAKFDPGFILVSMKMYLVCFLLFLMTPFSLLSPFLA